MAVAVTIPAALTTVEPGRASTCEIRVGNAGTAEAAVRLDVHGEAAPWAMVVPPQVIVPAGGEVEARLVFNVPRAGSPPAGLASYRVTATGPTGEGADAEGFLEIAAFTETTADLVPRTAQGPSERSFLLSNRGNCEIRAAVTAAADDARASVDVQPRVLVVEPGQTGTAAVRVVPPRRPLGTGKTFAVHVTAGMNGAPPVSVSGVVERTPPPPDWVRRLAASVIVPILVALVWERTPFPSRDQQSPREVVADAMQKVAREGTSRVEFDFEVSDPASGGETLGYRLKGVSDYRRNRGRFLLDVGGLGLAGMGGTVEVVKGGSALYLRVPWPGVIGSAKPWLLLGFDDILGQRWADGMDDDLASVVSAAITGLGSIGEQFQMPMEGAATEVKFTGKDTLRGASTRRYHLALDRGALGADVLPELQATVDAASADVWVDDRGRARRIRFGMDISTTDLTPPQRGTGTSTMEFFEFGVSADIDEPSPQEVVSVGQLPFRAPR